MKKIITIFLITIFLTGCKESKVTISSSRIKNTIEEKYTDPVLWEDNSMTVYFKMIGIEEWEEKKLIVYTHRKTLIELIKDNGSLISKPYAVESNGEVFFIIFEIWNGSGNLSDKIFYHFNQQSYEVNPVKIQHTSILVDKVKNEFNLSDSLYTKKGEWYKVQSNGNSYFNSDGNLPFQLILFKNANGYDEKQYLLSGEYQFIKKENTFQLEPIHLKLSEPH